MSFLPCWHSEPSLVLHSSSRGLQHLHNLIRPAALRSASNRRATRSGCSQCAAARPGADPAAVLSQPLFCAGALSAFGLITADVLAPGSFHVLAPLDTAVQAFATSNWPADAQARSIANAVSNVPITIALGACAVGAVASGLHAGLPTLRRAAFGGGLYFAPGWGLTHKDVPLLDLLKHAFRRARPGFGLTHSGTFSMPSGHTFTAFFFIGLAILLASTRAPDGSSSGVSHFIRRNSALLWALGGMTAAGRVLCDVHWASDTMAGATLAAAVVSFAFCTLDGSNRTGEDASVDTLLEDAPQAEELLESRNES